MKGKGGGIQAVLYCVFWQSEFSTRNEWNVPSPLIHYCCRILTIFSPKTLGKSTNNSCDVFTSLRSGEDLGSSVSKATWKPEAGVSQLRCVLMYWYIALVASGLKLGISETRFWDTFSDVAVNSILPHYSLPITAHLPMSGPQKVQVRKSGDGSPKISHLFPKKNKPNSTSSSQKPACHPLHCISRRWYIILKAWFNLLFSKLCGIFYMPLVSYCMLLAITVPPNVFNLFWKS